MVATIRELVLESRRLAAKQPSRAAALARAAIECFSDPLATAYDRHLCGCAWLAYGSALRQTGRWSEALDALDRAEEMLIGVVDSANELAQTWYLRGAVHARRRDIDAAFRESRRAATLFGVLGDVRRVAFTKMINVAIAHDRGDAAAARDLLTELVATFERIDDTRSLAAAWLGLGTAEISLGNIAAGREWVRRAEAAFRRLHVVDDLIRTRWILGWLIAGHESQARGISVMKKARAAYEQLGAHAEAGFVALDIAEALLREPGSAREAASMANAAIAAFQRAGANRRVMEALAYLREATAAERASPTLVGCVRGYIRRLDRAPDAPFVPDECVPETYVP